MADITYLRTTYNAAAEEKINAVGDRIKEYRTSYNMSRPQLCKELRLRGIDVTPTALYKWELGKSCPTIYQVLALCDIFRIDTGLSHFTSCPPKTSLNKEGIEKLEEFRELLIASGKYQPKPESRKRFIDMPVSYLRASAGTGAFLDSDNFEMVSFPANAVPDDADFGIYISGDSMEPVFTDGQIAWVKKTQELNIGDVGIFVYDGQGYIKSYEERVPEDEEAFTDVYGVLHMQPVLVSYNKRYAPILISPNMGFEIIGRVL